MKYHLFALMCIILIGSNFVASAASRVVDDPVSDYIQRHSDRLRSQEEKNEHILKFEADIDNDGKTDIFLSSEKSSLLRGSEYENDVRTWDLYKNTGGGNYAVIDQEKATAGSDTYFHLSEFLFDPQKVYIGSISEIGAYGMLAMIYGSRHSEVYISAYILGNGYFESKNFPNPASLQSGIYHRDENGEILDMPESYKRYFATPPKTTVTTLPQTF